ncbi:sensor histidine kinase [Rugamonas apoptosis]|uniref:Oxygen sensor histidine kinase NreB n=1 Tax=Rugamonas apoptosis TaxID=2758570 RepID=A0A7W2F949_9BURK|nr:sensor histidine kinase [Rugamonas apoptosis]MBA5687329.1 sensor histidine kinase [Rugamonas apoptosis]
MKYAAQSLHVDLITAGALMLTLIALALLWRQRRLRCAVERLQQALATEQGARAEAELRALEQRTHVCQLLAQQDNVLELERQRIARDIHDDLGQNLLALKMDLAVLSRGQPRLQAQLHQIEAHITASIRSLRVIIHDLRPEPLNHGLRSAVESQVTQFSRLSGIACRLDADQQVYNAAPGAKVDAALFRVLQESPSNIARHANATQVDIALRRHPGSLMLTVSDNGVGLPARSPRGGNGLSGIADRVARAGGQFHVASRPGQGTALSMSFPLSLEQHQTEDVLPEAK